MGAAAGMGASALDAVGGPKTLLTLGGAGAGAYALKKLIGAARGAAPAASTATPPPATEALPPAPAPAAAPIQAAPQAAPLSKTRQLSAEDIKTGKFGSFQEGHEITRGKYEAAMVKAPPAGAAKGRTSKPKAATEASARPRAGKAPEAAKAPPGSAKGRAAAVKQPPGFTESGNPQRGKFGEIGAEPGAAPRRVGNVIEGASWAGNPSGAAAARQTALDEMAAARTARVGSGVMREAATPALLAAPALAAILRHLLSGGDIRDIGDPENIRNLIESAVPQPPSEPKYGEPGYRGQI